MQEYDPAQNLSAPYQPVAVYYEQADTLEYTRRDAPSVYRRIDEFLTLIIDMDDRERLVGFQLKGFKNFFLQDDVRAAVGDDFLSLVGLLERAFTKVGGGLVDAMTRDAYERARKLALEDGVEVHDLPRVA